MLVPKKFWSPNKLKLFIIIYVMGMDIKIFIRFISIFICIVWRSPNKNTILHVAQKKSR